MQRLQVGARIMRICATESAEALARATEDRITTGGAVVVSLGPLQAHLGESWSGQAEGAWAALSRALPDGACARITATEALVLLDAEAQALAFAAAGAAIEAALGVFDPELVSLLAVRSVDDDELTCAELDPHAAAESEPDPAADAALTPVVFTAANGQKLRVDFVLEPIRSLRHGVVAVLRVEPTVTFQATGEVIPAHRFHRLADSDLAAIDTATLTFGASHVPEDAALQPPVILPVSFRTMGGRKGRHLLLNVEGLSAERVRQGAMIEFVDIDRGTPLEMAETAGFTHAGVRAARATVARREVA